MPHLPVLVAEAVAILDPRPGDQVIDGTVGPGGHARALLLRLGPAGRLLALDRDPSALSSARQTLGHDSRVTLAHGSFADLKAVAEEQGVARADRILLDLGVSSLQLDNPGRGFAFSQNGPLDMRLDPTTQRTTAADLVNRLPLHDLRQLLDKYGEEPHALAVARAIVAARKKNRLETTHDLLTALAGAHGRHRRRHHPATLTFQALRLAVNRELEALAAALPQAIDLLVPEGRLAVISFHSLEDRIVKNAFRTAARDCICPPEQPICTCRARAIVRLLTPKAIQPTPDEIQHNPRSRSARLRAIEKRTNP